jgi:Domain of unknown function (DUF4304)
MIHEGMGLKALTNDTVDPTLHPSGFRRRGLAWNRTRTGWVDVVEVQVGKSSGLGSEHFTLNVGIFMPDFYRIVWQKEPPQFVKEVDCVVRKRVGELLSPNPPERALDKWWRLESLADKEECEREVWAALTERVLPFLATFESARDIHAFLEGQRTWYRKFPINRLYLAVSRYSVGDAEGALRELRDLSGSVADARSVKAQTVKRMLFPQELQRE